MSSLAPVLLALMLIAVVVAAVFTALDVFLALSAEKIVHRESLFVQLKDLTL